MFSWVIVSDLIRLKLIDIVPTEGLSDLLKSKNMRRRQEAWVTPIKLVKNNVLTKEELMKYKEYFNDMIIKIPKIARQEFLEELKKLRISFSK